ncbi:MAG TPA: hypothetical protein VHC97_10880 [Thermoanaerobaculia bacterium]|jgi:hypothetical protein|nr:hypothetical protein [Thermoanaerobaculia bacterium]
MSTASRIILGVTLATSLSLLPARVEAHPPDAGTLETVVTFDPSRLEMPESIEIDRQAGPVRSLHRTAPTASWDPAGTPPA